MSREEALVLLLVLAIFYWAAFHFATVSGLSGWNGFQVGNCIHGVEC